MHSSHHNRVGDVVFGFVVVCFSILLCIYMITSFGLGILLRRFAQNAISISLFLDRISLASLSYWLTLKL